ncbi:hypothetical protein [uncultured Shewanella sp.]|uniref:hypothetical protein n=1 Tax=uncultured Shewanella sp. TaxID=173975 RepID=UPI0026216F32|nr:hypothetical protein [uncultured Shewanella sp.]
MQALPEGTLILKPQVGPSDDDINEVGTIYGLFAMYKPEGGYCPEANRLASGMCSTGDWMWIQGIGYDSELDEYRFKYSSAQDTLKIPKCLACHGVAARTDSVFNLFISRRFGSIAN